MKKTFVLFFVILFAIPSFSQDKTDVKTEKNVFKINTLSLFFITPSIFYERKLSDMTSAQLGVGYMGYKISDARFSGIILTPGFSIYPKKNAID